MNAILKRNLLIGLALIIAFWGGIALKPTKQINLGSQVDLEAIVPKQFADWAMDENVATGIVNPEVANMLDQTYGQILSRTYVNKTGQRIMLSIAYGANQKDSQVHRPETCYASQGFKIDSMVKDSLVTQVGNIPVMKLVAIQGERTEPIIYWVRIGRQLVRGNLEQGFARLSYGLSGEIPDGMLFRVSSLSSNKNEAFDMQTTFVNALLGAVAPENKIQLIGKS